jgi:hypothetical protein
MKLHFTMPGTLLGAYQRAPKSNPHSSKKIESQVPPPDEETLRRLNAKVKEYPFCIYYKEKKNDPL